MTKQPEALMLADELTFHGRFAHESEGAAAIRRCKRNSQAAAELRRLHEEVKCEERRFNDLWEQFAALDKVNQELLEALKEIADWTDRYTSAGHPISTVARAAIAKATGEQA